MPERPIVGGSANDAVRAEPVLIVDANGNVVNPAAVNPAAATDRSLGVTTTAQTAMPANANRKGWKIKNDTAEAVWVRFGGTAVATAGGGNMRIAAGGYLASEPLPCVETSAMSIIHASTGTLNVTITEFS